jgi:EAL domain-containing protein (putative c-di-GMP-specific phosphodiesterase class I)
MYVFENDQEVRQQRRLQLSADLPEAVDAGHLRLVFQPKVSVATGAVLGAEALLRWKHATLGEVPPAEFVALAESTGSTGAMTRRVVKAALQQLAAWRAEGLRLELAVNLSAGDIIDTGLPDFVLEQLRAYDVPATALLLEITESAVMRDVKTAASNMEHLRVAGVRFAIDDFGTGYSSLSQLKGLPVDEIKIDRTFVRNAAEDENDALIVRSTIELGHSLGLRVVAEGVENDEGLAALKSMGCDQAQGFGIARPMDPAAFLDFCRAAPLPDEATGDTVVQKSLRLRDAARGFAG